MLPRPLQPNMALVRWLVATLLLWLALIITAAQLRMSPTFDEQNHVTRGIAILRTGDFRLSLDHPPIANLLEGLPVAWLPNGFSTTMPAWREPWKIWDAAATTIWQRPAAGVRLIQLARLPVLLFALVMGLVLFRWSRELFGPWGGLLSLAFFVFDPNILAHGGLATTDIAAACTILLAAYAVRWYLRTPSRKTLLLAGSAIGVALSTKFSGLILAPIAGLLLLSAALQPSATGWGLTGKWRTLRSGQRIGHALRQWLLLGAIAGGAVWAIYGFQVQPLGSTPGQPMARTASMIERVPVPALQYLRGLKTVATDAEKHTAYLLGETDTSGRGWWYYFPVAVAVKTPVPELIALVGMLCLVALPWGRRRLALPGQELACLLIPAGVYLLAASGLLGISLNLGLRHLLPLYPFLLILAGGWIRLFTHRRAAMAVLGILLVAQCASVLAAFPNFLSYFNEPARVGGEGHRILNDSNYDWGQDLGQLAQLQRELRLYPLAFSYFGTTPPAAYDLKYMPLAGHGIMERAPAPSLEEYHGYIAISITNLVGGPAYTGVDYRPLLTATPIARAGNTIYIYQR